MDFDKGNLNCRKGVSWRHAGVGQSTWVDDNPCGSLLFCRVYAFDQSPFVVALEYL